jgi:hypothetical protein
LAKIINFPNHAKVAQAVESSLMLPLPKAKKRNIGSTLIKIVWVLTVLLFPLLELILLLDCVFQFFRMLYYWNTKEVHAGLIFVLHFLG